MCIYVHVCKKHVFTNVIIVFSGPKCNMSATVHHYMLHSVVFVIIFAKIRDNKL